MQFAAAKPFLNGTGLQLRCPISSGRTEVIQKRLLGS